MKISRDAAETLSALIQHAQVEMRFTEPDRFDADRIAFYDELKALSDLFDRLARDGEGTLTVRV